MTVQAGCVTLNAPWRWTSITGSNSVGVHVVERLVAQDAGVVDDDVDGAERVDRGLHDRLAAFGCGDRVGVGDGLAAGGLDLVDDELGGTLVAARAVDGAAEIVHHDQRAALGEHAARAAVRAHHRRR